MSPIARNMLLLAAADIGAAVEQLRLDGESPATVRAAERLEHELCVLCEGFTPAPSAPVEALPDGVGPVTLAPDEMTALWAARDATIAEAPVEVAARRPGDRACACEPVGGHGLDCGFSEDHLNGPGPCLCSCHAPTPAAPKEGNDGK